MLIGRGEWSEAEQELAETAPAHGRSPIPASPRARSRSCVSWPRGAGDKEIADRLCLSGHTVHLHISNIRTKLGLPSRAAAVAWAAKNGIL